MLLANQGEDELNKLRDAAREIAKEVDREQELEELTSLIGALMGTRDSRLVSPLAKATRAIDSARQTYDDLTKLDTSLDRRLDDIDTRLRRIEQQRTDAPGVTPPSWRALTSHAAPEALQ